MNKRLVALSLLMSLAATAAVADSQHYATAPTKKDAERLATAAARTTAQASAQCFKPARQVDACEKVDDGFRCRADTSDSYRTCRRAGWVNRYAPSYVTAQSDPRQASFFSAQPANAQAAPESSLYGRWMSSSNSGPPAPTPFPSN